MAKPTLIKTGAGQVAQPGRLKREEDGTVSASTLSSVFSALERLTAKFNDGISLGDGTHLSRAGNLDAQILEFKTHITANTEFAIDHSLGRVPIGYLVILKDQAATLYNSNFGGWSNKTFYLKCNKSAALLSVIVF